MVDRYDIFSWHCAAGDALEVIKDQNNGEDWCLLARKSRFSTCFDKAKPHTPSMTLTHYVTFMSHSDFCCTLDSLAGNMRYEDGSHTYSTTSMFPSRGKEKQSCAFSFSLGFLQNLNLGPQEQWGWGKEQGGPFKFGRADIV